MFGALKGKLKIKGDIVHFDTTEDWEVLRSDGANGHLGWPLPPEKPDDK